MIIGIVGKKQSGKNTVEQNISKTSFISFLIKKRTVLLIQNSSSKLKNYLMNIILYI